MYVVKIFCSTVLALVWGENVVESVVVVLNHRVTLFAGLSNGFKKQEMCVMHEQRGINVAYLLVRKDWSLHHNKTFK